MSAQRDLNKKSNLANKKIF